MSVLPAMSGVLTGSWAARAPAIRDSVGAGDTAWGLVNGVANIGTLVGGAVVLIVIARINIRWLALAAAATMLAVMPLMAAASTVALLGAGLVVWAFAGQLLGTPNWALQLEVQRRYGRPLLGTFVACWSFGTFAAGGISIGAVAAGATPLTQLAITSALFALLLFVTRRWMPEALQAKEVSRPRLRDRFTPQLRLLASMRLLTIFMSAAAGQWAAIYTASTLDAGPALGAATYTGMSIANSIALLLVGRVMSRVDQVWFFRISTTIAAAGLAGALLVGSPAAAIAGFSILGLGTACIDPLVYGLAGQQPGVSPAEGVSVVETGELPGALISSTLIGLLAGELGLQIALTTVVIALALLPLLAGWLKTDSPGV